MVAARVSVDFQIDQSSEQFKYSEALLQEVPSPLLLLGFSKGGAVGIPVRQIGCREIATFRLLTSRRKASQMGPVAPMRQRPGVCLHIRVIAGSQCTDARGEGDPAANLAWIDTYGYESILPINHRG